MAKPTVSRSTLRRSIAAELQMPFFKYFADGYATATKADGTGATVVDTTGLAGFEDDRFNNGWLYVVTSTTASNEGQLRQIADFASTTGTLTLDYVLPAGSEVGLTYEIHSVFSPNDIHRAINRAINQGFPAFFDIVTDETLVVQEHKLTYDISALTYDPWRVVGMMVEHNTSARRGQVTSTGTGTFLDTTADFSDASTDWLISIYDGTGAGNLGNPVTLTSDVVTYPVAWTTAPDTTSKYCLWNPNDEQELWQGVLAVRFNAHEYPDKFYLFNPYIDSLGLRIRLKYATPPLELSADTAETPVPSEFIIPKAVSLLATSRVGDNRADRTKYQTQAQLYAQDAEMYAARHAFRLDDITLWQETDRGAGGFWTQDNPMGW